MSGLESVITSAKVLHIRRKAPFLGEKWAMVLVPVSFESGLESMIVDLIQIEKSNKEAV